MKKMMLRIRAFFRMIGDIVEALFEVAILDPWRNAIEAIKEEQEALKIEQAMSESIWSHPDSIKTGKQKRKEPTMALKLDVEAIRKRVLEQAVVVFGGSSGKIDIAVPTPYQYWLIVRNTYISPERIESNDFFKWQIRPGDRAQFSDDGEKWVEGTYTGLVGTQLFDPDFNPEDAMPFGMKGRYDCWRYIRPVPADSPEKVEILRRAKNMERELAQLKKQAEEMK